MDEVRLQRIASDVAALNVFALGRARAAVNIDPAAAAQRYGLSLLTAQRIGRLPHAALGRFGDISVPLVRASVVGLADLLELAGRSINTPPLWQGSFTDGTDPDLARVYLQTVRQDAWRYPCAAAVRWSWPVRTLERLVALPVTALLLAADALTLSIEDSPCIGTYLAAAEAEPMGAVAPLIRLSAIATLGASPEDLVA